MNVLEKDCAASDALAAARARVAELERSNAELELFASVAAHELAEPLRKLQAMAELLRPECAPTPQEAGEYMARMRAAAGRMDGLVQALLALARVGRGGPTSEEVALDAVLAEVAEEFVPADPLGSLELGPLPVVRGDAAQLALLFRNLLSNAFKFRRPAVAARVRVACARAREGTVDIEVRDNGIGFDAAQARRIFEPFARLNRVTDFEGSGLGLTLCARIAARHGGAVGARSEPGGGSVFVVTLPPR
ncbi:MAG: hypothetical protein HY928_12205 [Elusimicrobia bacterium]|nr:hypothetical protein [Elusimicrobiota bacterium]